MCADKLKITHSMVALGAWTYLLCWHIRRPRLQVKSLYEFDTNGYAKCSAAGARDIENVLMAQVTGKLAEWVLE